MPHPALPKRAQHIARRRGLSLLTWTLAAALAGCGSYNGTGDEAFQEYDTLESQANAEGGEVTTGCGASPVSPSPASTEIYAFNQPPILAPVPLNRIAARAANVGNDTAVAAPVPGDGSTQDVSTQTDDTAAKPSTSNREVKILVENQTFKVEGPDDAIRVSYDDIDLLRVLNMEPVTADAPQEMPDWLRELDGRRIRIRGYMFRAFKNEGLTAFALARDNQICCFVREPKIYDVFPVKLRGGVTTDYIQNRPFDVVGVFHISPIVDEGQLLQLYRIDDAVVIQK